MNSTAVAVVVLLVAIGGLISYVAVVGYNNWQTGLAYDRDIGGYFEYADRASDAKVKADNFNKYINALESNGLTTGENSVWYTNQPTSQSRE